MSNPLVSICLFVYNHEEFVREAVEGLFRQTYSPLEIILSDDCSSDRSYALITKLAQGYRGPHRVVVNRTAANGGMVRHVNTVMALAQGQLVVAAGGDDISLPDRVEVCYRAWSDSGRRAGAVWSAYTIIDENGTLSEDGAAELGGDLFEHIVVDAIDIVRWKGPMAFGCTQAWSAEVFRAFGDLAVSKDLVNEDSPIFFRSALASGLVTKVKRPLVLYRRHRDNCSLDWKTAGLLARITSDTNPKLLRREWRRMIAVSRCFWLDIRKAEKFLLSPLDGKRLAREAAKSRLAFSLRIRLLDCRTVERGVLVLRLLRVGRGRQATVVFLVNRILRYVLGVPGKIKIFLQ